MSLNINAISAPAGDGLRFRDLSLRAPFGEITGLCGRADSGFSELLRLIAGRTRPESGSVAVEDGNRSKTRNSIVYMPPLAVESGWRNFFGPRRSIESTGGFFQIQSLKKAVAAKPKVLLINQALCMAGPEARDEFFSQLRDQLAQGEMAVVYASPDYGEMLRYCDRVSVLDLGHIVQSGTPEEVYESPATIAVATVTGQNNLITARRLSSKKADIQEFQTLAGEHRLFARRADIAAMGPLNQNVTLAIRPEDISISFGASFPEDNLLRAQITAVRYLGPSTSVSLDCSGIPIKASVPQLVGLGPGDECMVGLPPDRFRILIR